jgi:hypothetical protein|tara:strand:- start:228 stop:407 length:180 start_codon:yes stop_codon:yes gene_type:complete
MDGISLSDVGENLSYLSDESFSILLKYFRQGSLTSQEQSSLRNEITELKDMWKELHFKD